jgi:cbb3-type cytochrome oxidase maturation protein
MTSLAWLVPLALLLGGLGLTAFLWALRSGQFDDLEGAAYRILEDDREEPSPTQPPAQKDQEKPEKDAADKQKD